VLSSPAGSTSLTTHRWPRTATSAPIVGFSVTALGTALPFFGRGRHLETGPQESGVRKRCELYCQP